MKEKVVNRIREFNRFYLPSLSLLGDSYLGSEYSAAEARVLFEIYTNDGCTAAAVAKTMNIDKSYLSRIIRSYERKGCLRREISKADSRAYELHLTVDGIKMTEDLIGKSNERIREKIKTLSVSDCMRLVSAIDTVTDILKGLEE